MFEECKRQIYFEEIYPIFDVIDVIAVISTRWVKSHFFRSVLLLLVLLSCGAVTDAVHRAQW